MVTITLNNITNLNNSLQVGDLIYTVTPSSQLPTVDLESSVGNNQLVGILRRITQTSNAIILDIDETTVPFWVNPSPGDFIMFSKWSQTDGDVIGYYAEAKFKNNSIEKAELFSVGSEVIINSK